MKTYSKTRAAVLTGAEIAHLNTIDLASLTPARRRKLDARARATVTACNRVIRTARRMGARNAGRPESTAWAALNRIRADKASGEPVRVYRGTAGEFVAQGLDYRAEAKRADSDTEAAACSKLATESFRAARKWAN